MVVQCCVCGRVRQDGQWSQAKEELGKEVSHGYCPECSEQAFAEIRRRKDLRKAQATYPRAMSA